METLTVEVISRKPSSEEVSGLAARYSRKALTSAQRKRRVLVTLKLLAGALGCSLAGFLGYLWSGTFDEPQGFLYVVSNLIMVCGFAFGVYLAFFFFGSLFPAKSYAPKKAKQLSDLLLSRMFNGHNDNKSAKSLMIEEIARTLPSDSEVTEEDIQRFVSLNDGQLDSIWGYLWADKNEGWKVRGVIRSKSFEETELFPGVYEIAASAVCNYKGSLRTRMGGRAGSKTVTYRKDILSAELKVNFVFVKNDDLFFNYDYSPEIAKRMV